MTSPATLVEPLSAAAATKEQLLGFLIGYVRLLSACYEAREQSLSPADRPVEYLGLLQTGVEKDVLLWMLYQGHLDHFERRGQRARRAEWSIKPSAVPGERSAFALTPLGEYFGEVLVANLLVPEGDEEFEWAWKMLRVGRLTPHYDRDNRLLAWGRHVLKSYCQPSVNQERILATAEELHWAAWFDDPLPGGETDNPKVRLHDTIKNLNRHQNPHLVRFKGNGTGECVGWELQ